MRRPTFIALLALTGCASSPPPAVTAPPPPPPATVDAGVAPEAPPPPEPAADAGVVAQDAAPETPAEPTVVRWRLVRSGRETRVSVSVEQQGASPQTHDFGVLPNRCNMVPQETQVGGMIGSVECSLRGEGTVFIVWAEPGAVRISSGPVPIRPGAPRPADVTLPRNGNGPVTLAE